MIVIDSKVPWVVELAWLVAILAELGHERSIITREYLHSIIFAIGDEQETSMRVERQAHNVAELAISMAWLLGADRELDSSISIESIVSHLFHFNLPLSTAKRDIPKSKHEPKDEDASSRAHEMRESAQRSNKQSTKEAKNRTSSMPITHSKSQSDVGIG